MVTPTTEQNFWRNVTLLNSATRIYEMTSASFVKQNHLHRTLSKGFSGRPLRRYTSSTLQASGCWQICRVVTFCVELFGRSNVIQLTFCVDYSTLQYGWRVYYIPQTKVDWTSTNAFSQFKLSRKEMERIINGPLVSRSDRVTLNHVYIWGDAHAESLIEARLNEDPGQLRITTPSALLDQLAKYICQIWSDIFRCPIVICSPGEISKDLMWK